MLFGKNFLFVKNKGWKTILIKMMWDGTCIIVLLGLEFCLGNGHNLIKLITP